MIEKKQPGRNQRLLRLAAILLLLMLYGATGVYLRLAHQTGIVYSHLAYIPIVLAGMWWGYRGLVVAFVLGVMTLCFRAAPATDGGIWSDVIRVFFFVLVSSCVCALREKTMAVQRALAGSEERYRLVIERSLSGIFVYHDNRILFSNSRFGDMLGCRAEYLVGRALSDLLHEEDRPEAKELFSVRTSPDRSEQHRECRFLRTDGSTMWGRIVSSGTDYEGQPATLVNVYDTSERKEAEERHRRLSEITRQQEEQLVHSTRLAELGEMAAAIAHELNQPLTGIRNFASNASYMIENRSGAIEDIHANLRLISGQVDRASKIINKVRQLARRSDRRYVHIDLNAVLREAVDFLMPQFNLSQVQVHLDLDPNLPEVSGDRIRLEQVFLNLLTNARQAMEEATDRRLFVRTRFEGEDPCPIVIEVEDTGPGFAPEDAEKLFEPFYTTKKPGEGTGLGLSISLTIAREHGGRIDAEGTPGKGARFIFRLPARAEPSCAGAYDDTGGERNGRRH